MQSHVEWGDSTLKRRQPSSMLTLEKGDGCNAERAQRREVLAPGAEEKRRPRRGRRTEASAARSACRRRRHRLQLVDHARLNEHANLLVSDRHVEHLREHRAPQVGQPARAVCLLGPHAPAGLRTAALRIAFDQRDEALIGQLLMLGAQAPAGRRMGIHARAQALVQQDGAGIERRAANEANMLFEGNV
jgi:hypothetical protein